MKKNYIKKVLETLKNEGDIEITFIDVRGNETKIKQYNDSVATCMYNNGYSTPRYYNINENKMLMIYKVCYGEFAETIDYADSILYLNIISYQIKYL